MKIHKFNMRYVIAKNKIRKDGKAPLFCRLTYLEKRRQFSTGLFVNPNYWDSVCSQINLNFFTQNLREVSANLV